MTLDMDHLSTWIGKTEEMQETLSPELVGRFNATLGTDFSVAIGDHAPLLIHLCLAQPTMPADQLGEDGHPRRGGFMPPINLPRRMWAGGEMILAAPLLIGARVTRTSIIDDIKEKQGSTGGLCFVTVRHEISADGEIVLRERQDIVYRDPPDVGGSQPPPSQPASTGAHIRHVDPTSTMLFRYSAITFNGHRIHYDAPYARDVEGYDGLVVHGPMQATFMAQLASEVKGKPPKRFAYRGKSPLFAGSPFTVNAAETDDGMSLWTAGTDGPIAMQAFANW
ncbi:MaoC family dehydratase N-terminal domain-containing protein [Alphaproteobacteria bacterium]|nr:MaoC family dehydratase N-terminal domain-containing protein [Alphaproteobacteria bacterium]